MSIITYKNGATRDTETMCGHCKGNCACPGVKADVNARPGCGGGTCCCPPPLARKAHVTFSMPTVVAVKIRGEGGSGTRLPHDGGLVAEFLKWSIEAGVLGCLYNLGGYSGGGGYLGFYEEDEAKKVRAWLETHGAVEDDEKTWERRR